jgi:EpsI family protein
MAIRALILILVMGAAGVYAQVLGGRRVESGALPDLRGIPAQIDGWMSEDFEMTESSTAVLGADEYLNRRYEDSRGAQVWVFMAYFREQQVGSQIHSPRNCVPGSGWEVRSLSRQKLLLGGVDQSAQQMMIERSGQRQEMLYWFRTRGGTMTGEYALKWDLLRNSLLGRPTNAVFVRFSAIESDADAMRDLLARLDEPMGRVLAEVGIQ